MSQTPRASRRLCRRQLAPKRLRLDVVGADPLAVDLDDGDQLAVPRLERGIAVDPDLLELEAEFVPEPCELRPGALAEVAAVRLVEDDARA